MPWKWRMRTILRDHELEGIIDGIDNLFPRSWKCTAKPLGTRKCHAAALALKSTYLEKKPRIQTGDLKTTLRQRSTPDDPSQAPQAGKGEECAGGHVKLPRQTPSARRSRWKPLCEENDQGAQWRAHGSAWWKHRHARRHVWFRSLAPENAGESPFDPGVSSSSSKMPSDLCVKCNQTVEEDCVRLGTYQRWHSHCVQCAVCGKKAAAPMPKEKETVQNGEDDLTKTGSERRCL
ncbi:hypothetical protein B0H13DRAFT_1883791 [Mycena leptocephala]|nr:hypothetical protein B0H13DRAFT_1883791 [Mycena leptocephala]